MTPADTLRASETWAKFCVAVLAELPPEADWAIDLHGYVDYWTMIVVSNHSHGGSLRIPVADNAVIPETFSGEQGARFAAMIVENVTRRWENRIIAAESVAIGLSACRPTTSSSS